MVHRSLFGRAGWGRFSGLVGGAYGRCSTDTNDTIPQYDFSYALQSAADPGAAAHGPINTAIVPAVFALLPAQRPLGLLGSSVG